MRALIAAGADVKTDAAALVAEAHARGTPEVEQILAQAGVDTRDPRQLRSLLGGPNTLLEVGFPERLLARGAVLPADDLKTRTFGAPVLGYAAVEYGLPSVRLVLDRGADPNHRATRGITPLMMAAGATEPDAAVIQLPSNTARM